MVTTKRGDKIMLHYVQVYKQGGLIAARTLRGAEARDSFYRMYGTPSERQRKHIGFGVVSGKTKAELIDICAKYHKCYAEF